MSFPNPSEEYPVDAPARSPYIYPETRERVGEPTPNIPPPPPPNPVSAAQRDAQMPPQVPPAAPWPPPTQTPSQYGTTVPGNQYPPVYTQQPYAYYQGYASPSASGNAVAALVCGILAWSGMCFLTGLPAAILGFTEVKRIDRGEASPAGRGMALWGAWLGLTNTVITVLIGLAYFSFIAAMIGVVANSP